MREGWEIKKLVDITSFVGDGDWIESKDQSSEGIRLIQTGNIGDGLYKDKGERAKYISTETFHRLHCTEIFAGDCLVSRLPDPIGRACILPKLEERTITAVDCSIIRFKKNILPQLFVYFSQSSRYHTYINTNATGTTRKRISRKRLEQAPIPVPPVQEQEKIVAELDCLSGIIEKKKQQLKELDNLAQSIFYDMFGDPITNEKGWEVKEISSLFEVGSSKRVFESQWRDEGVPFYRAREIVRLAKGEPIEDPLFIEETMFQDYSKKYGVPKPGDMMITGVGTLGVCYIVQKDDRFYFKDGNIIWFKQKGLCETRFIKEQYSTDYVKNQIKGNANGATVGTYTITNANKTKVIVPPLDLQSMFVKKIEAIDQQKELIKKSIQETETLFNSRMDYWFN